MKKPILIALTVAFAASLAVTAAWAAAPEDLTSGLQGGGNVKESQVGLTYEQDLPNLKLASLTEKDSAKPEIIGAIINPANRNQLYISVRSSKNGDYPYVARLYRYNFATQKLERIYREANSAGFYLSGFAANKLVLIPAPYGDNSPGPCWLEEVLSYNTANDPKDNTKKPLKYLDIYKPASGLKLFKPTKAYLALRTKALNVCAYGLNASVETVK